MAGWAIRGEGQNCNMERSVQCGGQGLVCVHKWSLQGVLGVITSCFLLCSRNQLDVRKRTRGRNQHWRLHWPRKCMFNIQ
jgi:hypothetical protein